MHHPSTFPTLHSERLLLRQITEDDLQNIFSGLSHPDVIRYYGVSYHSPEATKVQMKFFKDLETSNTGTWWAVCNSGDGSFFGAGGLNNVNPAFRKAEIGFWLMPEYWGYGFMKEGMKLICDYAFQQLHLHRIEGFVETENRNCRRALHKLDFVHEGTMKDCEIKDGRFISLDIFAKINKADFS